jgi:hypothetical protein
LLFHFFFPNFASVKNGRRQAMGDNVKELEIIRVDYQHQLNYAMQQGGEQCLRFVEVANPTDEDWHEVSVQLGG